MARFSNRIDQQHSSIKTDFSRAINPETSQTVAASAKLDFSQPGDLKWILVFPH
jgi:hypothetical protein